MRKKNLRNLIVLFVIFLLSFRINAAEKVLQGKLLRAGTMLSTSKGVINLKGGRLSDELGALDGTVIRVLCDFGESEACMPVKYEISPFMEEHSLAPWTLKRIPKYVYGKHFAFNPKVTPDGNMLFWTAYVKTPTYSTQKIWASVRDEAGFWSEGFQLEEPLNNNQPSAVISALPGGNELFIFGSFGDQQQMDELNKDYNKQLYELSRTARNKDDFNRKKEQIDAVYFMQKDKIFSKVPLYFSRKMKDGWSAPKAIDFPTFYNQYRRPDKPNQEVFGGSTLSSSGKILIYSSQQVKTAGKLDLYVSIAGENDVFPLGANLGNVVNSEEEEMAPFLASDDRTLYFSRGGEKGTSIYMTKRLGEGWGTWSTPKEISTNLKGVNFFSIPASFNWAFISKNSGDLMMAYLPQKYQPDPVILITGTVRGEDGQPLSCDVIIESLTKNKKNGSTVSDPSTGKFSLVLPYGERYGFYAEKKGYLPVSKNIDLRKVEKKYQEIQIDLMLPLVKERSQITMNNLFFETKKYDITPESEPELGRLAKVMKENPAIRVQIEGHTDSVGKNKDNQILSQKRASSVAAYLIEKQGIATERLVVQGFGETRPVVKNDTPENRQQNRRVVFKILD